MSHTAPVNISPCTQWVPTYAMAELYLGIRWNGPQKKNAWKIILLIYISSTIHFIPIYWSILISTALQNQHTHTHTQAFQNVSDIFVRYLYQSISQRVNANIDCLHHGWFLFWVGTRGKENTNDMVKFKQFHSEFSTKSHLIWSLSLKNKTHNVRANKIHSFVLILVIFTNIDRKSKQKITYFRRFDIAWSNSVAISNNNVGDKRFPDYFLFYCYGNRLISKLWLTANIFKLTGVVTASNLIFLFAQISLHT